MANAQTVNFRLPSGDVITIRLVDLGGRGVTFEPVSNNGNHVHHHAFEDSSGNWNILIRDRQNHNLAAFILNKRNGSWQQRELTNTERKR